MRMTRRDALLSSFGVAASASLSGIEASGHPRIQDSSAVMLSQSQTPLTDAPLSLNDYEALAKQKLSHVAWEYYASGSGDEHTVRWNREALAKIRLKPRVLIDMANIDTRIKLLGDELPHPILLAPTSTHMLAHPEGEVATVRGAGAAGATLIVSTVANRSIEEVAQAATRPIWFQLYVEDDRGLTRALIERAEAAGCRALCITVDNPWHYARNRQ